MELSYRTQSNAHAISAIYNKPLDNKEWFKVITAKKQDDSEESEILLFDYIGWPYNDPRDFIQALSSMGNVLVRVNSPGGDVFDGAAIFNSLTSHKGNVTIRIEGIAASMASVIAMAGKKVQAYDNTMLMIHNAWTIAAGNQYEYAELSEFLAKVDSEVIMGAYQKKTKKSKKEICEMMKATTYMTAKEAKEHGFIDEIVTGKSVKAEYDLSIFGEVPEDILNQDDKVITRKEFERALRNAGASRSESKLAASVITAQRGNNTAENQRNVDDHTEDERKKQELAELTAAVKNWLTP
jgi:ATP-dependent Clp protease protease subunit